MLHDDKMFINAAATFAPLVLSSGSVFFMARAYAQRVSKWFAMWVIAVWCVSQVSMGLSALLFLHTVERTNLPIPAMSLCIVMLLLTLWLVVSCMFVCHALSIVAVPALLNIVVHFVFVGVALSASGKVAMLLALLGTLWAMWTLLFAVSFVLYLRRKSMTRLSDAVMDRMRVDTVYELHRTQQQV